MTWTELALGLDVGEVARRAAILNNVNCICDSPSLWQRFFYLPDNDIGKWEIQAALLCFWVLLLNDSIIQCSFRYSVLVEEAIHRVLSFLKSPFLLYRKKGCISSLVALLLVYQFTNSFCSLDPAIISSDLHTNHRRCKITNEDSEGYSNSGSYSRSHC